MKTPEIAKADVANRVNVGVAFPRPKQFPTAMCSRTDS